MSAAHTVHSINTASPVLYVAFEVGWITWKMAFTIGAGRPPRVRSVPARCTSFVMSQIKKAKLRFGFPADAPVLPFAIFCSNPHDLACGTSLAEVA
jgi:hypothetical protein